MRVALSFVFPLAKAAIAALVNAFLPERNGKEVARPYGARLCELCEDSEPRVLME
jgi:hypothetical protein